MKIFLAVIIAAIPVTYIIWDRYFRIFPLSYFGIENVQRIAKWESPEWRERIFSRGGMTSHEWLQVNKRQLKAIDDELRRRKL
ncbi:hypothetical protein [Serratia ureilytica]|uniref:hypothetical protein n=1 Tax=Serratia ureilytica TaxID=300181 RepID=UPI0018665018|nr:hypothetical protein [Serratia ureilytica]